MRWTYLSPAFHVKFLGITLQLAEEDAEYPSAVSADETCRVFAAEGRGVGQFRWNGARLVRVDALWDSALRERKSPPIAVIRPAAGKRVAHLVVARCDGHKAHDCLRVYELPALNLVWTGAAVYPPSNAELSVVGLATDPAGTVLVVCAAERPPGGPAEPGAPAGVFVLPWPLVGMPTLA